MEQRRYKEKEKEKERDKERIELSLDSEDYTSSNHCSYCGAEIEEDDMFCPECGGPRGGIKCPVCGVVNHGSFCSNCNAALDDLAREAVRQAKADPHFQKAEKLAEKLVELDELIARLSGSGDIQVDDIASGGKTLDTSAKITDADRAAINRYASLFGDVANVKPIVAPAQEQQSKQVHKKESNSSSFNVNSTSLADAVAQYKAVAKELEAELAAMLPEPTATPQEQRNFFSARKITTMKMKKVPQYWICNYCGCKHRAPSECCKPWLGGHWTVTEVPSHTETTTLFD